MKTKNIFKSLPKEDQDKIIALCDHNPYPEVLDIIAKPRPEGLQLQTSHSALCRFYCQQNREVRQAKIVEQSASSLQFHRQMSKGSFRGAILNLLETRIFEALRKGTPVSELKDEFGALKEFHKGFLAEEKWRRDPEAKPSREALDHFTHTGKDKHFDFLPLDEHGQPTEPPPMDPAKIAELTAWESEEVTEADIARLDEVIALHGGEVAGAHASAVGLPPILVNQRMKAYRDSLRARGITAAQAALEIHNRGAGFAPDGTRLRPGQNILNAPLPSQSPPPAGDHNPQKSTSST